MQYFLNKDIPAIIALDPAGRMFHFTLVGLAVEAEIKAPEKITTNEPETANVSVDLGSTVKPKVKGTKTLDIARRLDAGEDIKAIALATDSSPAYVYSVKSKMQRGKISVEALEEDAARNADPSESLIPKIDEEKYNGIKKLQQMGYLSKDAAETAGVPIVIANRVFQTVDWEWFVDKFQS